MRRYSNPDFAQSLTRLLDSPAGRRPRPHKQRQIQRRLSREEVDRLIEGYETGTPLADLASTFEIHRNTVLAHLNRRGMEPRYGIIERNIEEAARLYEAGSSLAVVGQHFGVHAGTVLRALRAAGVSIRPRRGWA